MMSRASGGGRSEAVSLIETVRQQLPWHWLPVVDWPRGVMQKIWDRSVDFVSAGGFWRPLKEKETWYQGLLFCKKIE